MDVPRGQRIVTAWTVQPHAVMQIGICLNPMTRWNQRGCRSLLAGISQRPNAAAVVVRPDRYIEPGEVRQAGKYCACDPCVEFAISSGCHVA